MEIGIFELLQGVEIAKVRINSNRATAHGIRQNAGSRNGLGVGINSKYRLIIIPAHLSITSIIDSTDSVSFYLQAD